MNQRINVISGIFEADNLKIKYWSEYDNDGKTMYFKPNQEELVPIKGMRRNKKWGYYTKRTTHVASTLQSIVDAYK